MANSLSNLTMNGHGTSFAGEGGANPQRSGNSSQSVMLAGEPHNMAARREKFFARTIVVFRALSVLIESLSRSHILF
ncbi:hypothetical protein [Bradyrhizobium sp. dw_78]|uniref:hypothetical protein n=1 Tax=Bradyrhizobium sp. dw_78 TaxID=2719793 RepID=UPI001BD3962D|nr:hypothetical protein [Bradyrhizobium sp. dw_78]